MEPLSQVAFISSSFGVEDLNFEDEGVIGPKQGNDVRLPRWRCRLRKWIVDASLEKGRAQLPIKAGFSNRSLP